jgi:uncharacterized 2Fe-2S/4Fe-4S cluster protein (DUF4445 family)
MPAILHLNHQRLAAGAGQSLFDCAEQGGVKVPNSCGKNGKCRECLVEIVEGMDLLSARTSEEHHLAANFRLSCRAHILPGDGQIRCHTMRRGSLRIEVESDNLPPGFSEIPLEPAVRRDGDRILVDGRPVATSTGPILGVAMDLGTTTVALRVYDLETGHVVGAASFENPQRFGGSDIMARIAYDSTHPGRDLQRTLLAYLGHALEQLPLNSRDIYELIVVGNATMRDLFFGLSVETIGQKPYWSITEHELHAGKRKTTSLESTGKKLRLPIHPAGRVVSLPLITSHVGADTAACLLAIALDAETRNVALMDIGTNTEIVCGNKDRILASSCPAGPAFEGGAISCGMPGLQGAIERVAIAADHSVSLKIIDGVVPEGICGSGFIDALSEFLKLDIMDSFGRFTSGAEKYLLDAKAGIYITEGDISELAQAKGANIAGMRILLKHYGLAVEDVDVFYLAGGFARHIDVEAAKRIGLIPNIPSERILKIGNAALAGAGVALLSVTQRARLETLVHRIGHVALESDPGFFNYFVEGCLYDYVHTIATVP